MSTEAKTPTASAAAATPAAVNAEIEQHVRPQSCPLAKTAFGFEPVLPYYAEGTSPAACTWDEMEFDQPYELVSE